MSNLEKKSLSELLDLAMESFDTNILETLSLNSNMQVRRAVAVNKHTSSQILNTLVYDSVLNVSYIASQNLNCRIKRTFIDLSHPCVTCNIDERKTDCKLCKKK